VDLEIEKAIGGHYVVWRFNRPRVLNALTDEMILDLGDAVADFASDPRMRAAILTGTGRSFSVGADLKSMSERNALTDDIEPRISGNDPDGSGPAAAPADPRMPYSLGVEAVPKFPFGNCPKPVIAAVNGLCIAGGMEMAIDCDIRIATPDARFGLFEAKRGIMAGVAVQHLARVLPVNEAMHLLLTCDTMNADRAHQLGFLQQVTPAGTLMDRAVEIAEMISANAPLAVQGSKAMVQFWRHFGATEARRLQQYVSDKVLASRDAREGPLAFAEKRPPNWVGA